MTDWFGLVATLTDPRRAQQAITDAITVTEIPDRMVAMLARCTFPRDDENGFHTDHPCGWEGFVDFAVFDTTKEAIGVCPECEHEIYGDWTAT